MGRLLEAVGAPFSAVETLFDRVKLGYKWRFNRWKNLCVLAYRGHGTPEAFWLRGRVLDDRRVSSSADSTSVWQNVRNMIERVETDEVPGARVRLTYGAVSCEAETDVDGYFDVTLRPERLLRPGEPWQEVTVELLDPPPTDPAQARATACVFVPDAAVAYGVISDVDDTVVQTGATDTFRQIRTVWLNNAHTRLPFAGVAAFYQALHAGPDGRGHNPLFYVSSSPWNLYDLFDDFMRLHGLPAGPLFFKDFGFGDRKFIKTGHTAHKLERIRILFDTYPHLAFVLVGDSGQQDPEVYRQAVEAFPGRVRAVYIRDVSDPRRDGQVHAVAEAVEALGVPMRLVADTAAAAEHAAGMGLIRADAVEAVRAEMRAAEASRAAG